MRRLKPIVRNDPCIAASFDRYGGLDKGGFDSRATDTDDPPRSSTSSLQPPRLCSSPFILPVSTGSQGRSFLLRHVRVEKLRKGWFNLRWRLSYLTFTLSTTNLIFLVIITDPNGRISSRLIIPYKTLFIEACAIVCNVYIISLCIFIFTSYLYTSSFVIRECNL